MSLATLTPTKDRLDLPHVGRGRRVMIIGAGLAGCLMARFLRDLGYEVDVYERRPDPRAKAYAGGRSINLALSARGLAALRAAGLEGIVRARDAIPMPGRMIHGIDGAEVFQPYSSDPRDAINSVSRGGLNRTLLEHAAADGADLGTSGGASGAGGGGSGSGAVRFHFDHTALDIDLDAASATFATPGGAVITARADLILGCDGAFSPLRLRLQKTDRFEYQQTYIAHGYKELTIPAVPRSASGNAAAWRSTDAARARDATYGPALEPTGHGGAARAREHDFAMDPRALHIWPRGSAMMIALPNRDATLTCTLFWPYEGPHSFGALPPGQAVRGFFEQHYPDAAALMPELEAEYARNPVGSLVTVRCWPWAYGDRACILGDAAHAIVPFYGQGMNAAFEDCLALAMALAAHDGRHGPALEEFQRLRKPNADAIADMALDNFVEMRDKVGDAGFRLRKRVEQALHRRFPDRCQPQYNLVSFSTVPYVEARARGRALDALLDRVLPLVDRALLDRDADAAAADALARVDASGAAGHAPDGSTAGPTRGRLIDLSPAITPTTPVWPGDTPVSFETLLELEKGHTVTLSTLRATLHLGSHADGPNHYQRGGVGVGERALELFVGPCHVVHASASDGVAVRPTDLGPSLAGIRHPRVLVRTGSCPAEGEWNPRFVALSPELIDALAARGVRTIGTDAPSVDPQESKTLDGHAACARHDIQILEGLRLHVVPPGEYELIAPPLRLMGRDASPIRAILRPLAPG